MEDRILGWVFVAEIALFGAMALALPRIGRRGLLFGVYVGEAAHDGEAARALRRTWYRGVTVSTLAGLLAAASLTVAGLHPLQVLVPELAFVAIGVALYLRSHRAARRIAEATSSLAAVPPSVATLTVSASPTVLPWIALFVAVACGVFAIGHAASHFDALPERIPVHFNGRGEPDGWAARRFGSVMVLPIMTAVTGVMVGGIALLVAHAKRAIRSGDGGASLVAQDRFRTAMARFLSILGILTVALLTSLSFFSMRVALGRASGLPGWFLLEVAAVVAWTFGGIAYAFVRYGQGGARLEGATSAPLTDGLADNRFWKLGVFYVNRDDPSWLVEHRFGLGYTLNLGNTRAVAALGTLLAVLLALAVWAIASS